MKNWTMRFVLGITGSMGGGKSTVTEIFEKLGAYRISADEIARTYTNPGSPVQGRLVELLGKEILDEAGNIDRKRIAGIVFSDKNAIAKLNSFVHPLIREKTMELIQSVNDGRIIAWEAPLLFEVNGQELCDSTLTVSASYSDIWKRVKKRDSISEEEFKSRLANQMEIKKKIELSEFNIVNDKDVAHLEVEAKKIYTAIMKQKLS